MMKNNLFKKTRKAGFLTALFLLASLLNSAGLANHKLINESNTQLGITITNETQQKIVVRGTVQDEQGDPLPGTTIVIVGSTQGVITDIDGIYAIEVNPTDELLFSFVGYESQTVKVNNQTQIN